MASNRPLKQCQPHSYQDAPSNAVLFYFHTSILIFLFHSRCFWLFTLICALLGSIYVCLILSQRFNAGSLQTVVDSTNKPVFHIPFPEVSICNANHLNWDRLEDAKHHFMPYENDTERLRMFELVIGLYDKFTFGDFKIFEALDGEPIELVSNINFSLVYDYMTWHCDELLKNCLWRHYRMNCCEIFSKTKGQSGICWHFNTLSNEEGRNKQMLDEKYPWRVGSAGPTSALNVRVMINEKKHFRHDNEKGVWVSMMKKKNSTFLDFNLIFVVTKGFNNGTNRME